MVCKEYQAKKKAAESRGLKYCGSCRIELDPAEFAGTAARCRVCVANPRPSNYRAPRERQSLSDLCPAPSRAEVLATVQARHDQTAEVIESHARMLADRARAEQSAKQATEGFYGPARPVNTPRTPIDVPNPSRVHDTPEYPSSPVWATEDAETQKRLEALRKQLNGD